jgi:putative ABC transport system permease protein
MSRTFTKLILRKIRGHLPQFICTTLLIMLGTAFFVTLYTIYYRYNHKAEELFEKYNYADITYYGNFEQEDIDEIIGIEGLENAVLRKVQDIESDSVIYRIITLTEGINDPYIYQGKLPEDPSECLILNKTAKANGYKLGDLITVSEREYTISGIIASPEYVYLVKNERSIMSDPLAFAAIYVNEQGLEGAYNELLIKGNINNESLVSIEDKINAQKTITKADQINYNLYLDDLDQIRSFAYIFPSIFIILIIMIIYVTAKRSVIIESKRIGFLKALGTSDGKIIALYSAEAIAAGLIGSIAGLILSMLICNTIIGFFSAMFEVPQLCFKVYPFLFTGAIFFACFVCLASALFSLIKIYKPMPAELTRGRIPTIDGKKRSKENKIWSLMSFNTKYAIKSAVRNKGRFIALTLGIAGSCALLIFALGFYNSIDYSERLYFDEFIKYDAMIEIEAAQWENDHPVISKLEKSSKALAMPVSVKEKEYRIVIVDDSFDMLNLDNKKLSEGIIIPQYYADSWGVKIGEKVLLNDIEAEISGIVKQSVGLTIYTSYQYASSVFSEMPHLYNIIFVQGSENIVDLSKLYNFKYTTIENDRTGLTSIIESLETLILFMLICAAVLGITILYSIGLINLSAREYEYMFMGVMGYPTKYIVLACIKEAVMQLILALPSGFIIGNILLNIDKEQFTGENFVIYPSIYWVSYLLATITVLAMSAIMIIISAKKINKLNIVEGLKIKDE